MHPYNEKKSGRRKQVAPWHTYCFTGTHRVNLILTYITLKGEETRKTSHTGQGWTAAHCRCFGSSHLQPGAGILLGEGAQHKGKC